MLPIPLTTTTDSYDGTGAATFDFGGTGYASGTFLLMNNSGYISVKVGANQGQSYWEQEFLAPPSSFTFSAGAPASQRPRGSALIYGIRARTKAALTAWNAATAYAVGDTVSRAGASYVAILASTNQQPPNATYWTPLAAAVFGAFYQPGEISISSTAFGGEIAATGTVTPPSGGGGTTTSDILTLLTSATQVFIDENTAGDKVIVANPGAQSIMVINVALQAADAVTVQWFSGSSGGTELSGPMTQLQATGFAVGLGKHPTTDPGDDLVLTLSDAVQVGGWLSYVLI